MWWLESVLGIVVLKWEFSILEEVWNGVTKLLPWISRLWPVQGWGSPLGGSPEGHWTFSKNNIWKAQEQASPMCLKTNQQGRKLTWMNRQLLIKLKGKKYIYQLGRRDKWFRKITRVSLGYAGRKSERPKAQLEFNLTYATRDSTFFPKYINKRAKETLHPLLHVRGLHVTLHPLLHCHQGWGKGWGTWCFLCFSL